MGNNKLYKYLDVNGGLSMLLHHNLQFTKASKLNDPFDCHPALIDFSDVPIKKVQAYPEEVQTALQPTNFEKARENEYICSLSKNYDSVLMWSYYTNHKGICVGIDMKKARTYFTKMPVSLLGCLEWEVQYRDIIKKPEYITSVEDLFKYQMTTKAIDWKHEEEIRLFSYSPSLTFLNPRNPKAKPLPTPQRDHYYLTIGQDCFESIHIGYNMDEENKKKIIRIAQQCNPSIKIYEMVTDRQAFKLKEKPIGIRG